MLYQLINLEAQPPAPPQSAPLAPRHRRRHTMWVEPWILQRDDTGAYTTIMLKEMLKERLAPRLTKQKTNWSVGLKIATTLRYLATGETYTSLHYQFRTGKASICNFEV